jgi:hypothetical protein
MFDAGALRHERRWDCGHVHGAGRYDVHVIIAGLELECGRFSCYC